MASEPFVPKPADPGPAQTAIANTKNAYVNVRTGPGVNYRDIGDIRDNSLVIYYPKTRTSDNWYWVEYRGLGGWVAGSVTEFEQAIGGVFPPDRTPTPYDNKVAIWHWKGTGVAENTIEELASEVVRRAPNVKQIWVKTSDGPDWMGEYDASAMAINGPQDVARWVNVLGRYGLEFHAWCVPTGVEPDREVQLIAAVCNTPGVKSMVLDIEPYAGFWQGGREGIRPFGIKLRSSIDRSFHVGMSVDPRPWHYASVYPDEWLPFINSIHPQTYWKTFRQTPEEALQQTYNTWGSYGRPIVPALQGDADVQEQEVAHTLATQRHGAPGLSWWRYGVISQHEIVNRPVQISTTPDQPPVVDNYTDEVIVKPKGDGFRSGSYTGRNEFSEYVGTWNWPVLYKSTEPSTSKVWAEWKTNLPQSGRYEISTFSPARHATTTRARFKIHGVRGTNTEVIVDVNQSQNRNIWVSLGVFDLVKGALNAGKVFLNDVTGESDREIAFDAIRFRRVVSVTPGDGGDTGEPVPPIIDGVYVADGYDPPVGSVEARNGDQVWGEGWRDATGFGSNTASGYVSTYRSYHTGVDLNYGTAGNSDLGLPVYAPASGVVTYQADLRPWGNVTIIKHDPLRSPTGLVTYTRYGHMQNVRVEVGDRVKRGQQIGEIGTGGGRYIAHLHYDVSPTTILELRPGDWPGLDLARLQKTYADPLIFTRNNRPVR